MVSSKFSLRSPGRFLSLVIVGTGITVATGAVYGRLTQRWGPVPDLQAAGKHVEDFPAQIGDWQLVSEEPISESTLRMLSCEGHINRQYVNRQSGAIVSFSIIVGPTGPTAVHTPEICYSSRAYSIQDPRERVTLLDRSGKPHSFWSLSFRSNKESSDLLRVYYAWCADARWTASESPRFEFGGRKLLYKLQMSTLVPAMAKSEQHDACQEFLSALLGSHWRIDG